MNEAEFRRYRATIAYYSMAYTAGHVGHFHDFLVNATDLTPREVQAITSDVGEIVKHTSAPGLIGGRTVRHRGWWTPPDLSYQP